MINKFRGKYAFLSNFYSCVIIYNGLEFGSVEAAYQAQKTLDLEERKNFTQYDAKTAKKLGKLLTIRENWDKVKLSIMTELLMIKFSNSQLKALLFSTGIENIVEENTWQDAYWGVCNGEGLNHLGKQLMIVRSYYKNFDD